MLNNNEFAQILRNYCESKPFINGKNDKVMIAFLGIPCSGKTTLAKALEKELKGLRISKDEIVNEFMKIHPDISKSVISGQINQNWNNIFTLIQQYPNQLLILDTSLDRKYKKVLEILVNHNYKAIIINLEIDRELVLERLKQRNPDNYEDWYKYVNQWEREHEGAVANIDPDLKIRNLEYATIQIVIDQIKSLVLKT